MPELVFDCLSAEPDRYGAAPAIVFKLRVSETSGDTIHFIALRCQIRIEPHRRRYSEVEAQRVMELFGEQSRWGDTLKPMQFAFVDRMIPGFSGSSEVDLTVPVTYDFDVANAKYFGSLDDGEIPLLLLFSGTVVSKGETGFSVQQVPWHKETVFRLPVSVWRATMDMFWPNSAWLRLRSETFDRFHRYKAGKGLPTWDDAIEALMKEAGEET